MCDKTAGQEFLPGIMCHFMAFCKWENSFYESFVNEAGDNQIITEL